MPSSRQPRVALVHDYLTQYGGAEKVLEALFRLWPSATVFTTFHDAHGMRRKGFSIPANAVHSMLPYRLRFAGSFAKAWTPLYPALFRGLKLVGFDLIVSSSSFAAHHVRKPPGAVHIAYMHTPARFLYGLTTEMDHARLIRLLPPIRAVYPWLRGVDQRAVRDIDVLIANSREVQHRIERAYHRRSTIIYPPVDIESFARTRDHGQARYFMTWGRLVRSKRVDLIVQAASSTAMPLIVAGEGPEEAPLRRIAGPTVSFVGRPSTGQLVQLLEDCTAVVFAAEEDFGIVPVEAMAAGKPVIAYGSGGALESVIPGITGELFPRQDAATLASVLCAFDAAAYDPEQCRRQAARFSEEAFSLAMLQVAERLRVSRVVKANGFQ